MQPNDEDTKQVRDESDTTAKITKSASEAKNTSEPQEVLNHKRHRNNDTTPPPELGQNLNA
jgi:hypothetical protein